MVTQNPTPGAGAATRAVVVVRGRLTQALVRIDTGSEHESWVIDSPEHGRVILKALGANPFEKGAPPAEPGSEVEVQGYLLDHELRYTVLKRV